MKQTSIVLLFLAVSSTVFGQFWCGAQIGLTTVAGGLSPGIDLTGTFQINKFPITLRYSGTEDGGYWTLHESH